VWSEAGNWIQVRFLHVVIKVTRGKREGKGGNKAGEEGWRSTLHRVGDAGRTEGEVWKWER